MIYYIMGTKKNKTSSNFNVAHPLSYNENRFASVPRIDFQN